MPNFSSLATTMSVDRAVAKTFDFGSNLALVRTIFISVENASLNPWKVKSCSLLMYNWLPNCSNLTIDGQEILIYLCYSKNEFLVRT